MNIRTIQIIIRRDRPARNEVIAMIVRLVWRSPVRYTIRAARLPVAALLATPYAFAYDKAALAIPVAFLAGDQISCGMLKRGKRSWSPGTAGFWPRWSFSGTVMTGSLLAACRFAPFVAFTLLAVISRRALYYRRQLAPS